MGMGHAVQKSDYLLTQHRQTITLNGGVECFA
jgi:hypothetical protein